MDKKVSIILLNYKHKGIKDTLECIKSLEEIDYDNYEIIIVDNHSDDGSYDILKDEIKNAHILIEASENGGFAKGNNIGIEYALENGSDFVLLLNNDTIVEKKFLKELIDCYNRYSDSGIVTSKILYEGKRNLIWFAGGEMNLKRFYGSHYGEKQEDREEFNEEKSITFATGCVMLISKEMIHEIGMLPTEYFMYYEDVDYCLRVQQARKRIYYCPKSVVYHKVSAATGGEESPFAVKWNTRNRIIFMNKYKHTVSPAAFLKSKVFFYLSRIIKSFLYYMKGNEKKAAALWEGIKEGRKYEANKKYLERK